MVGALQKFSSNGKFQVSANELDGLDVFDKVLQQIKAKNFEETMKLVNDINSPDNFFSFLYKNIDKYYTSQQYAQVVMVLAKYQSYSSQVRDKNLNLSACCAELMR